MRQKKLLKNFGTVSGLKTKSTGITNFRNNGFFILKKAYHSNLKIFLGRATIPKYVHTIFLRYSVPIMWQMFSNLKSIEINLNRYINQIFTNKFITLIPV